MPYIEICILSHFSIYFSLYIYTFVCIYMPLNHLWNFHGKPPAMIFHGYHPSWKTIIWVILVMVKPSFYIYHEKNQISRYIPWYPYKMTVKSSLSIPIDHHDFPTQISHSFFASGARYSGVPTKVLARISSAQHFSWENAPQNRGEKYRRNTGFRRPTSEALRRRSESPPSCNSRSPPTWRDPRSPEEPGRRYRRSGKTPWNTVGKTMKHRGDQHPK